MFSSVQSLSRVRLFATPWIAPCQASLSITNSRSSPKLMSIELAMPSRHLILCRPLLLLPPIPPSIRVFSNQLTLRLRWPKYWSFSFSIIPSKEIPGLISFRMDWLDLLQVQETLKSLVQHHSSKASILRHSAFFTVQLSHPYTTTGKTIALTRWTFVGKVMSLLFNMLHLQKILLKSINIAGTEKQIFCDHKIQDQFSVTNEKVIVATTTKKGWLSESWPKEEKKVLKLHPWQELYWSLNSTNFNLLIKAFLFQVLKLTLWAKLSLLSLHQALFL